MPPRGDCPEPLLSLVKDTVRQTGALQKSPVAVHHRSACSGVKALRNTSAARRQAAKLCCRFGPLTPTLVRPGSRALDILCVLASPGGKLVTKDELVERAPIA